MGAFDLVKTVGSRIYGGVIRWRNDRFDRGHGVTRVEPSVISVGNLSMGGTGKTPMVRWVVGQLSEMDLRPAILTRGYGAKPGQMADEVLEYRDHDPDVPIFVGGDRVDVLRRELPSNPNVQCVVMDDGFQHRALHRDLDLVLIAQHDSLRTAAMLPMGRLREPLHSLARADAVIITGSRGIDPSLSSLVETVHGRRPIAWCSHVWSSLTIIDKTGTRDVEIDWLHSRRVVVRLGIGSPETVRSQLRVLGATVTHERSIRDHQPFSQAEASFLSEVLDADAILMTAKDWVKARDVLDLDRLQVPIVVPRLELRFLDGEEALSQLIRDAVVDPVTRNSAEATS